MLKFVNFQYFVTLTDHNNQPTTSLWHPFFPKTKFIIVCMNLLCFYGSDAPIPTLVSVSESIGLVSVRLKAHCISQYFYPYACLCHLILFKMAAKEVYCEVTVVDNEAMKSHRRKMEPPDTITKQIGKAKDQKKTSGIWTYFKIDSSNNNKAVCLTFKEKISLGGSKLTKFNTSKLRKPLMTHNG